MTWALIALATLLASLLVPTGIWLHAEVNEGKNLRDRLEQEQQVSMEYRHQRDEATARLAVSEDQLEQERNLRVIAERQRNEAMSKVRDVLAKHMGDATNEEIADIATGLFSALNVVRPQVSAAGHASTDDTDLQKPGV